MGIFDKLFGRKREKEEKRDKHKEDWSFYANSGNTYLRERKFTEAIADYTKAIESYYEPHLARSLRTRQQLTFFRGISYYYRGLSTHSKDDFKHAITDLETMRVFIPWPPNGTVGLYKETYPEKWAKATLMCGDASLEIGDYDVAINYYTELVQKWTPEVAQFLPVTRSDIERKRAIAERKRKTALAIPNIGKLKGRRDVEGLIKALGHKVEEVRWHAAKALGEIKDKRTVEPLIEALKDEWHNVRESAATALGRIEDERAFEPLIKVLREDPNKIVRGSAAYALGKIEDKRAVEPLIETLLEGKDSYVRSGAVFALGKIGDERAVELLKKILEDENEDVRVCRAAKEALKKIKKKQKG